MKREVILLNGPSSSGKSTLAKALQALSPCPMRMVYITCPLQLLKKRELERGDRAPGSAEASAEYLFPKKGYDLVVDTSLKSPAENSMMIFNKLF